MSEAMTSESIVEAEWLLKQGYWTKVRFAFKTEKGSWSDVDVLAYNPETKHLVISESKVRGPKDYVAAYTEHTREEYGSILEFDNNNHLNYLSFIRNIGLLCKDGVVFKDFQKMVNILSVHLVCNYAISSKQRKLVEAEIEREISSLNLPLKPKFRVDTTIDVIARIINLERASSQGRRYGHPVLDMAREINRYFKPSVKYAGRKIKDIEIVKEEMVSKFLKSIGIDSRIYPDKPKRMRRWVASAPGR